jgi:chorismate mutase
MTDRLGWMDDVAAVKQAQGLPITDPKREAALLQSMEERGKAQGIPAEASRAFFAGQMAAARQYQAEWLAVHSGRQSGALPDLANDIRPALDRIGVKMIRELAALRSRHANAKAVGEVAARRLTLAGYSPEVVKSAVAGVEVALQ